MQQLGLQCNGVFFQVMQIRQDPCFVPTISSRTFCCTVPARIASLSAAHTASLVQPIELIGGQLDVGSGEDRLSFLLSLVQAYRLLVVMSEAVPPLPGRWPLYSEVVRENSMYDSKHSSHFNLMYLIETHLKSVLLIMFALHHLLQLVCTLVYMQLSPH